jgi:hypothetical protein
MIKTISQRSATLTLLNPFGFSLVFMDPLIEETDWTFGILLLLLVKVLKSLCYA